MRASAAGGARDRQNPATGPLRAATRLLHAARGHHERVLQFAAGVGASARGKLGAGARAPCGRRAAAAAPRFAAAAAPTRLDCVQQRVDEGHAEEEQRHGYQLAPQAVHSLELRARSSRHLAEQAAACRLLPQACGATAARRVRGTSAPARRAAAAAARPAAARRVAREAWRETQSRLTCDFVANAAARPRAGPGGRTWRRWFRLRGSSRGGRSAGRQPRARRLQRRHAAAAQKTRLRATPRASPGANAHAGHARRRSRATRQRGAPRRARRRARRGNARRAGRAGNEQCSSHASLLPIDPAAAAAARACGPLRAAQRDTRSRRLHRRRPTLKT